MTARSGTPGIGAVFALLLGAAAAPVLAQSPVDRLRAVVGAANDANPAAALDFLRTSLAPAALDATPERGHVDRLMRLSLGQRNGLVVKGVDADGALRARAALENRLTGEIDSLVVETEPGPRHRILRIRSMPGAGGAATPDTASTDAGRVAALDRLVRRLAAAGAFSGVVLLARHGTPLYLEAFGLANRDYGIPNTIDTRFNLGSANKSMTAVMIGQLVEQGRLSWEDPLDRFVPGFPDSSAAARKIRIKHLLSHSAGLGSYFNRVFLEGSRTRWRTVEDFLALARPDSVRFEPGSDWRYSNTGFVALGRVIEVITGQDYFSAAAERLFRRAGMPNSGFFDLELVTPHLATGYRRQYGAAEEEWRSNVLTLPAKGGPAGGGWSTARDMLAYSEALVKGRLVSPATLQLLRTPKPELSSPEYGFGFTLFEGPDIWGHGGDFVGVDFDWNNYGDSGYTLIVLANMDRVNDPIVRAVTRMMRAAGAVAPSPVR